MLYYIEYNIQWLLIPFAEYKIGLIHNGMPITEWQDKKLPELREEDPSLEVCN